MQPGQPSRTALGAAGLRAAHQVLDGGAIFADPLAVRILGADADTLVRDAQADPGRQRLRWFIAIRSRIAEDALAAAVKRGVRQLVVLGAGLDTYAYRADHPQDLRIFEVDHPATQAWKRQRLTEADIPLPPALTFVSVDFERETLADRLAAANFDSALADIFYVARRRPIPDERSDFFHARVYRGTARRRACRIRLRQSVGIGHRSGAARRARSACRAGRCDRREHPQSLRHRRATCAVEGARLPRRRRSWLGGNLGAFLSGPPSANRRWRSRVARGDSVRL